MVVRATMHEQLAHTTERRSSDAVAKETEEYETRNAWTLPAEMKVGCGNSLFLDDRRSLQLFDRSIVLELAMEPIRSVSPHRRNG